MPENTPSSFGKLGLAKGQAPSMMPAGGPQGPNREMQALLELFGLIVAAVVVVLGLAYFIYPGLFSFRTAKVEAVAVSSVAEICERGWLPRASNDKPIMCYLQQNPKRLCDPQEQAALAAIWTRYRADREAYEVDSAEHQKRYLALMTGKYLQPSNQILQENMHIMMTQNLTFEERAKLEQRVTDLVRKAEDEAYQNDAERAAAKAERVSDAAIISALRDLGRKGLIEASDFDAPSDKLITAAFADIDMKVNTCGGGNLEVVKPQAASQTGLEPGILVMDLTGRGLNSTELEGSKVMFAFEGEEQPVHTAWLGSGAGFLLHSDGGAATCTASRFFGSFKRSGLAELAVYDDNHDGMIDKDDSIYRQLLIWEDQNGNGTCEEGELRRLPEARIVSLNLHNLLEKPSRTPQGNMLTSWSGIFLDNDKSGMMQIIFPTEAASQ